MEKKLNININITTLILIAIVLFVLLFGGWKYFNGKINNLNKDLETEVKLKNALIDNVNYYKNKEGEWTAEKLTIQESIKNLEKMNSQLTATQKELLSRVKEINDKNEVIAAALLETQVKIDSLLLKGKTVVDSVNKTIKFVDNYKQDNYEMNYSFTVKNVIPAFNLIKPTLTIDSLKFPNKQLIDFHWKDNKKEGYPVTFSVSNSNDFFKTVNIESYSIPEISKEALKPNFWQKIDNFLGRTGNNLVYFGVGGAVGAATILYLKK